MEAVLHAVASQVKRLLASAPIFVLQTCGPTQVWPEAPVLNLPS